MRNRRPKPKPSGSALSRAGFRQYKSVPSRRLVMSIWGPEKTGKTHFALTTPGPHAYIGLDHGEEGVVDKFAKGGDIEAIQIFLPVETDPQFDYAEAWKKFKNAYKAALEAEVKTLIIDTATTVHELVRMKTFGRMEQVPPHMWGPVNAQFSAVIQRALRQRTINVLFLHRAKWEYKDRIDGRSGKAVSAKTGNRERKGWAEMGHEVQVEIQTMHEDGEWGLEISSCRHRGNLRGKQMWGDRCNFPCLAAKIVKGTTPYDWGIEEEED